MNPIAPYRSSRARRLLCTAALFAAATVSTGGIAGAAERRGDVDAKIEYCQDCHGPSGRGYRGFFPIPRLAGQQPEYVKNQLQAFVERRRANSIMFGVAHVLSPAMIAALATDFHAFNPAPIGGAPKERAALGRKIFEDGLPDANIAACAACHGPDATGSQQNSRVWRDSSILMSCEH